MKVKLSISKPKPAKIKMKAKDYNGIRAEFDAQPYSACYEANPTFSWKPDGDNVGALEIKAKPVIAMPHWPGARKLSGQEKTNWNNMMKALAKHEQEHHAKFLTDAKAFKKKLESGPPVAKSDLQTKMDKFFDDAQVTQDAFDKSTNHGGKKGVKLPPVP